MRSVRLFDCLQYDGDSWQVVAQEGTALALKSTTGRIRKVTLAELLGDDSYLPDSPDRLPNLDAAAVLETLEPEARLRAEFLHRHVVEVLSGVSPVADGIEVEPRPEYHPGTCWVTGSKPSSPNCAMPEHRCRSARFADI